jgi:small nuclear ribonucleoprotein (snRNP)-like protein
MNIPPVKDFFTNKVNVQLKSGQRFEGLLSRIDYKTNTVVLEDVEDLGNELDKNFIPHDKKIAEKAFECDNISEIFLKEKHFSEPKKYKKEEFWDAISEPQPQQHKKYKAKYEEDREHRPKRNYDNRNNNRNYEKREPYGNRQPKEEEAPRDRDLR